MANSLQKLEVVIFYTIIIIIVVSMSKYCPRTYDANEHMTLATSPASAVLPRKSFAPDLHRHDNHNHGNDDHYHVVHNSSLC